MRKFKILVIAHSLKNNQIGKSKDIVDETQLTSNAQELINQGFIEEIFPDSESKDIVDETDKPIGKMSVEELKDYAKDNELNIDGLVKKADILEAIEKQVADLN